MGQGGHSAAAIEAARVERVDPVAVAREPASGPDDAALVERIRGDPAAFAPLYDRYFEPVYRYCHRRLGDRDRAAEATAQVFSRAIAALPRFAATGSFRAWLFAIAHNVVVDDYRERRHDASLEAAIELPDLDPTRSPERAVIAAEARQTVAALLAQLPDEQRRVVELRLAGLTGPEIAAATGRSLAAIKSLQFRAYGRLRRLLGERTEEGRHMSRERADFDREGPLDGTTVEAWSAYLDAVTDQGRAPNGTVSALVGELAAVDRRLRTLDAVHRPPVGEREQIWGGLMATRIVPAANGRSIPGQAGQDTRAGRVSISDALGRRRGWPIVPAFEIAAVVALLIEFLGLVGVLHGNEGSGGDRGAVASPANGAIGTPDARVRPVHLRIEAAAIDAPVEPIAEFALSMPFATGTGPWEVGWDERSAALAEPGNVLLVGHRDYWDVGPAVFYRLDNLGPGDRIEVVGSDVEAYAYVVSQIETYPSQGLSAEDVESIVGPTGEERLTLVTDYGEFDYRRGEYLEFLVVRAHRVAGIQTGTPAVATPVVEVACAAGPRRAESIAEIDGDPAVSDVFVASRVPGELPQLANYRAGRDTDIEAPAPPETAAAIAASLRELTACRALGGQGGVERVWALHSDDFFRRYDSGSLPPPGRAWWGGPGESDTHEIDAVVRLADGRVRAWLVIAREVDGVVSEGVGAVFVEQGGRWLLDEIAFYGVPSDPAHWPPAPAPGECIVPPRPAESLDAIAGTPVAATFGPAAADTDSDELPYLQVPQGGADPETNTRLGTEEVAATLRDTARVLAACVNAGDAPRRYALYSDDFVRRSRMIGHSVPDAGDLATAPAPLPAHQRVVAPALVDGIILPDGRFGFVALDWPSPPDERIAESEAAFVVFAQHGDRWLIDEVVLGRDAIVIGPEPLSSPTLILRDDLPSGFTLSVIAAQQVTVRVENPTDADRRFALPAAEVSTVVPAGGFVLVSFYLPEGEFPVTVSGEAGEVTGTVVVRLSESIAVTPHQP